MHERSAPSSINYIWSTFLESPKAESISIWLWGTQITCKFLRSPAINQREEVPYDQAIRTGWFNLKEKKKKRVRTNPNYPPIKLIIYPSNLAFYRCKPINTFNCHVLIFSSTYHDNNVYTWGRNYCTNYTIWVLVGDMSSWVNSVRNTDQNTASSLLCSS